MIWALGPLSTFAAENTLSDKKIFIAAFFYPPILIDDEGKKPGLYLDLARYLFGKEGYQVQYGIFAFLRAMQGTEDCEYDIIGAINKENSKKILIAKKIPLKLEFSFWIKKDNPWKYTGIESLKKIRVANIGGYNYSQASPEYQKFLIENPKQVQLVSGDQTTYRIFKMIVADRIDAFNIDRPQALWTMQKYNLTSKLKEAGSLPNLLDANIGFCPSPRGQKLLSVFDQAFEKYFADFEVRNIYKKYGLENEWKVALDSMKKNSNRK